MVEQRTENPCVSSSSLLLNKITNLMKHNFWNLLACLKNGALAKKHTISHTRTKKNEDLLNLLWQEGFISGYRVDSTDKNKLNIFLKYNDKKEAGLNRIVAVSKPSKKVYCSYENTWKLYSQNVLVVVSTTKGIKSLNFCRKSRLGGAILLVIN